MLDPVIGREDEMKRILDEKMIELVNSSDFGKRTKISTLEKMLDGDGIIKSQFETGTSGGAYNLEARKNVEKKLFNVPYDIPDVDRPIYGQCIPKTDEVDEITLMRYISNGAGAGYGGGEGCILIFDKNKVIDSATITIGDYLCEQDKIDGILASSPEFRGGFEDFLWDIDTVDDIKNASLTDIFAYSDQYLEIQLHGKETHNIDTVKEVIFTIAKPSEDLLKKLDAKGISWRILKMR